jgi:hypothetical protein
VTNEPGAVMKVGGFRESLNTDTEAGIERSSLASFVKESGFTVVRSHAGGLCS